MQGGEAASGMALGHWQSIVERNTAFPGMDGRDTKFAATTQRKDTASSSQQLFSIVALSWLLLMEALPLVLFVGLALVKAVGRRGVHCSM